MNHADFFSRNPLPEETSKNIVKIQSKHIDFTELSDNWLLAAQQQDDEIVSLINSLKNNSLPDDVANTYEMRSGILHRRIKRNGRTRTLPIVPRSLRWSVINNMHEGLMHLGWEKTLEKVYKCYWYDDMSKYVWKYIDSCLTCKVSKSHSGKIQAEMHSIPKVAIPWHTIHIDATGKLSGKNDKKEYVFVIIDAFTKYTLLYHTLQIDTANSVSAFKKQCFFIWSTSENNR